MKRSKNVGNFFKMLNWPPGRNLQASKSKDFSVYSHSLALPGATMFRPSVETEKSLDFTAFLAILGDPDWYGPKTD